MTVLFVSGGLSAVHVPAVAWTALLQVVESEILGDHSPPAICAEFDIHAYQIP